jgi:hypothetical protein
LDGILAQPGPYTDEQKAQAQADYDSLFNSSKVYQAKRGADAAVLAEAKMSAGTKLTQIKGS